LTIEFDNIVSIISGGVLGGLLWEGFKFFYPDLKNHFQKKHVAKRIIHESFDSTIKAADELFGKIESLVKEDFGTFRNNGISNSLDPKHNRLYILYLFAQFWAALENIRLKSNYSSIGRIEKGKELLRFIETFESRKFRILDRSKQRIIGEGMIIHSGEKFEVLPLYSFIEKLNKDPNFSSWIEELGTYISNKRNNSQRQGILVFGIIVAAFLEHFDPKHIVSRKRPIYLNRIRPESSQLIRNVLLKKYIGFIKNKERYYKI
tara:strand:+ start:3548 stop:4333 length:786 start_codon:yes stop_codon:yes gene_type:complete